MSLHPTPTYIPYPTTAAAVSSPPPHHPNGQSQAGWMSPPTVISAGSYYSRSTASSPSPSAYNAPISNVPASVVSAKRSAVGSYVMSSVPPSNPPQPSSVSTSAFRKLKFDDEFTLLGLEVEMTLFHVPLNALQQSKLFMQAYKIPEKSELQKNYKRESTIEISGVKADEFRSFLRLLLRVPLGCPERILSYFQLESALKLASIWKFDGVRNEAVIRLQSLALGPVRKIRLSQAYGISCWYAPELLRLALRNESLSPKEGEQIGMDLAMFVSSLRELQPRNKQTATKRILEFCLKGREKLHPEEAAVFVQMEKDAEEGAVKTEAADADATQSDMGSGSSTKAG